MQRGNVDLYARPINLRDRRKDRACQRCGQSTMRDGRARYCIPCKDALDNEKIAADFARLTSRRQSASEIDLSTKNHVRSID